VEKISHDKGESSDSRQIKSWIIPWTTADRLVIVSGCDCTSIAGASINQCLGTSLPEGRNHIGTAARSRVRCPRPAIRCQPVANAALRVIFPAWRTIPTPWLWWLAGLYLEYLLDRERARWICRAEMLPANHSLQARLSRSPTAAGPVCTKQHQV